MAEEILGELELEGIAPVEAGEKVAHEGREEALEPSVEEVHGDETVRRAHKLRLSTNWTFLKYFQKLRRVARCSLRLRTLR